MSTLAGLSRVRVSRDWSGGEAPPAPAGAAIAPARIDEADVLRVVGVIAVVCVHAAHWPSTEASLDGGVWNSVKLVMRFCVPVFVVLSGLLLGFRHPSPARSDGFLGRRFRRSIVPWLAWMPVYFCSGYLFTNDITHSLYGSTDWIVGGAGHLYFLLLAPQFYLVYLLWPDRLRWQLLLAAGCLAVQAFLCSWRLGDLPDVHALQDLVLWHAFEEFPFWIGYFAVGVAAGHLYRLGRIRPSATAAWASLALLPGAIALLIWSGVDGGGVSPFATGTGAFLRPLLIPVVLLLCASILLGAPLLLGGARPPRWMRAVSKHALGIYILQALLIYAPGRLLFPLLDRSLPWSALGFAILVPATLAVSLQLSIWLARTPLAATIGAAREHRRGAGTATG